MRARSLMALSGPVVLAGACGSDGGLPTAPPTTVAMVAHGGFTAPTDAVASPDGETFYFGGFTVPDGDPAVFRVGSAPGSTATVLAGGEPLALPLGLAMGCDGATIYVIDAASEEGSVFALPAAGGTVTRLDAEAIARPGGVAIGPDCQTLYVTGRTRAGEPALFALATAGGAPTTVYVGAPLARPTGLNVDSAGVAWVMDHDAAGAAGDGVLFAIPSDGSAATEVASGLRMGTPGGVSLTAGGGTAVMPTRDAEGQTQLTAIDIDTKQITQLSTPDIAMPAGLRTAREAGVFAVVDADGDAIFRAE